MDLVSERPEIHVRFVAPPTRFSFAAQGSAAAVEQFNDLLRSPLSSFVTCSGRVVVSTDNDVYILKISQ